MAEFKSISYVLRFYMEEDRKGKIRLSLNIITKFLRLFALCRYITQYCKKIPKSSENSEKFRKIPKILLQYWVISQQRSKNLKISLRYWTISQQNWLRYCRRTPEGAPRQQNHNQFGCDILTILGDNFLVKAPIGFDSDISQSEAIIFQWMKVIF